MGLFGGGETKIKADPLAGDVNASGKAGIAGLRSGANALNSVYSQDPTQLVNNQISMENKLARGSADDATHRTRALLSQRGMTNSSIGLGQEVNQRLNLNNAIAMNNASGMSRLRDMQIQNGQGQMQAGQSLWGVKSSQGPLQMTSTKYTTGGGPGMALLSAAGSALGSYLGSKAPGETAAPQSAMNYTKGNYEGYA